MADQQRLKIVAPGDDPPQIQGSPHLDRLAPYGDVAVFTDRPETMDEQLARVEGAEVIMNTRGAVKWYREALEQLPDLRLIATCSIGTDMVDSLVKSHGFGYWKREIIGAGKVEERTLRSR